MLSHTITTSSLWLDLFAFETRPLEKVIRTVVVYLAIAVIIRIAGKRLMAQMNSLDLVVILLLSNVVQNAIIGADNSLSGGLLGAVVLVSFNALLERMTQRADWLRGLLEGHPTTLIDEGAIPTGVLGRLGMSQDELDSALRHQGAGDVRQVERATLDPGGAITVDLFAPDRPLRQGEFTSAIAQLHARLERLQADILAANAHGGDPKPRVRD